MAKTVFKFATAFALALSAALPARALEPSSASETPAPIALELSENARLRYDNGEYARALVLFNEAYAREPDPNLLFNIARCHEKLGQAEAAIAKYDEFLASPDGDPTGREKAEASRNGLVKSRERQKARDASGPRASATFGDAEPGKPASDSGSPSLTPWILLGAGVVVLGSGVVVYSLGMSDHHEVENQNGYGDPNRVVAMTQRDAEERVDSGKRKKLVGGLLLGGGGALLASSALLFVIDSGPSQAKVGIDVSPRGGSVALRGRF